MSPAWTTGRVNYGGNVVIAAADVVLLPIANADQPTIFEPVCVRVVIGRFAAIVVALYRPDPARIDRYRS
jgi:hypothetical protein